VRRPILELPGGKLIVGFAKDAQSQLSELLDE
jgi:hypothetical protein